MAGTGRITLAPIITDPSDYPADALQGWLTPNFGLANMMVPIGQFLGQTDTGVPLAYPDLIPLKTSSISVVDSDENTIFSAGPAGIDFGSIMSIDSNNVLSLFKSDGTTSGISFNPNNGQINLLGTASGICAGGTPVFTLGSTGGVTFGDRLFSITNTTASTSSSTGALTVMGGIGIEKDSYFNGVKVGRGGGNNNSNTVTGRLALQNNVAGYYNSAFGAGSLALNIGSNGSGSSYFNIGSGNTATGADSLYSNTTGSYNTASGFQSLCLNTIGYLNTSTGVYSLRANTSGNMNAAVGYQSLGGNQTGNNNTSMGANSFSTNLTGSLNVAIGSDAGRRQANGTTALTDPESSIYIGANSRGFSNADQNSIVIGASAIGEGANTTVIGNSDTTKTHLYGNVVTQGVITCAPGGDIPMFTGN